MFGKFTDKLTAHIVEKLTPVMREILDERLSEFYSKAMRDSRNESQSNFSAFRGFPVLPHEGQNLTAQGFELPSRDHSQQYPQSSPIEVCKSKSAVYAPTKGVIP